MLFWNKLFRRDKNRIGVTNRSVATKCTSGQTILWRGALNLGWCGKLSMNLGNSVFRTRDGLEITPTDPSETYHFTVCNKV